ncbi:hypothetical protein GCM10017779_21400 [Streptomyces capillispiralis]|nr:hypothetical protein GCM10017779_21400 [Streptomyces capillispiralis]
MFGRVESWSAAARNGCSAEFADAADMACAADADNPTAAAATPAPTAPPKARRDNWFSDVDTFAP